jgi:hypothetical protein
MSPPRVPRTGQWPSQWKHDAEGAQVVLEDGDPRVTPPEDAVAWDWDAEAVAAGPHCRLCGSLEALFKLEDGTIACRACCHGQPEEQPPSRLGSGGSVTPGQGPNSRR